MALIRRHWKLACFQAALMIFTIVALLYYELRPPAHAAASTSGSAGFDCPTAFSRINAVRVDDCLTDIDLLTLGCSQSETANVLQSLISWYANNSVAWGSDAQQLLTQESLTQAIQQIGVGPHDASTRANIVVYALEWRLLNSS